MYYFSQKMNQSERNQIDQFKFIINMVDIEIETIFLVT